MIAVAGPTAFTGRSAISGSTRVVIFDSLPCRQNRRDGNGDNRTTSNRGNRKSAAMKTSYLKRFTLGAAPFLFLSLTALHSATPTPSVAPDASPASVTSGPQQQPAQSAVKVTLLSFTPMARVPGGKDFKIATLTFKIEASAPVAVTEASFYVDSGAFDDGPAHNVPINLLVHTGIFLGPPGTKVDPGHPIQRTVWLKSQENVYPNWSLAYNQTENATFRWTIGGQPVGGPVAKPLHKAWP